MRISTKIRLESFVWLMGLTSTMPVLSFSVSSREISIFRLLFYGMIIALIIRVILHRSFMIGKNNRLMVLWLTAGLVGGAVGYFSLSSSAPAFSNAAKSYLPKTTAFLVFVLLWGGQERSRQRRYTEALIRGIFWGCALNAAWAILDAAGYYLLHRSINNIVFSGYIARNDIRFGELSLIINGMIRSGGFNYDPAQLGFMAPVLMCYGIKAKKKLFIVLSLGSTLASASTTAMVCCLAVFILNHQFTTTWRKKNPGRNYVPVFLAVAGVFLIAVVLNWNRIATTIGGAAGKFLTRVNSVYIHSEKADIRFDYFRFFPLAFFHLGAAMLTGTGFGTASYGYVTDPGIAKTIGVSYMAYDPENTYICYLMDTGLIGFMIIMMILIRLYTYYRRETKGNETSKTSIMVYAGITATVFSMLFYHYILFAPQMLILIAGLCRMDTKDGMVDLIDAVLSDKS